jgi:type III secretion protein L
MYCFSLIKKGSVHTGKGKIIPKENVEELVSSLEILENAQEEAKELLLKVEAECIEIKKEAREAGFQEGLEKFNAQMILFEERLRILRHEMQKAMLPLVLKSTKRIIGEELQLRPESVVNIVMESIKGVAQCKIVRLYVNRLDLDILEEHKRDLKEIFENLENFQIEERSDIERGSCIIETEKGILNATLENQYRALERAFETHMKKR